MSPLLPISANDGPHNLRSALNSGQIIAAPGCYDGLGARLIEQAGFAVAYLTGFGTSASLLGRPDVGLLGLGEMVDTARRVVQATSLPVIADADTGYGNPLNVIRTVREYEQAGVAGLHLEDQVLPKRCGHMAGKQVVDSTEFLQRIEAAVAARTNPDLVIIARTDARAPLGLDEAIERARRCEDAGADMLFIEALTSEEELEVVATSFPHTPLVYNWVDGGRSPLLGLDRLDELGFRLVIFPVSILFAATKAMQRTLEAISRDGMPEARSDDGNDFDAFTTMIGLDEIADLEQRFSG